MSIKVSKYRLDMMTWWEGVIRVEPHRYKAISPVSFISVQGWMVTRFLVGSVVRDNSILNSLIRR